MTVYEVNCEDVGEMAWYKEPCVVGVGAFTVAFFLKEFEDMTLYPLIYNFFNVFGCSDEAGRGPVVGPMVYGIAVSTVSRSSDLKNRQFADSKVLTAEKRDELFDELDSDQNICCLVDEIDASKISGLMLAPEKVSLNTIAFESTVGLIQKCIDLGMDVQDVYVDTVGPANTYQERLSKVFPGVKFTVKPKADAIYPIVSAASIAAKVWRDRSINKIGGDRGSGYPSDPKTKEWLSKSVNSVFGFDDSVRFSWGTTEKILGKNAVTVVWECDEEEDQAKLTFAKSQKSNRHSYFNARKLKKSRL